MVSRTAEQVFIPLTVGGGVRTPTTSTGCCGPVRTRSSINTAAVARPELLAEAASRFGSQCIVLSRRRPPGAATPDCPERLRGDHPRRAAAAPASTRWTGPAAGGRAGAGEILLNSMDADGTEAGFDLELIGAVRAAVGVPLIASGGAGAASTDFAPAVRRGRRRRAGRDACSTSARCASARSRTRSRRRPRGPLTRRRPRREPSASLVRPGRPGPARLAGNPVACPRSASPRYVPGTRGQPRSGIYSACDDFLARGTPMSSRLTSRVLDVAVAAGAVGVGLEVAGVHSPVRAALVLRFSRWRRPQPSPGCAHV